MRAANLARLASGGNATNESMRRSGAKRAERGWGRAACEVYGALVERLTAKALRQMQHWTDIQVVSEPGGDFRSVRSTR